ncbi:hypothetical protein RRG08_034190 [Elysia crispata]|uniref:Uncharacterized protein n=1 Tax=Elysia crispata TaxID=231223 RepID=A0AAE1EDY8_9GAST|nr:hypothetical protein RRG08_034190 [Elysia crispata]
MGMSQDLQDLRKQSYRELEDREREEDRERGWEDNTAEWPGKALSDKLRRAKEREEWRELVVRCCDAAMVV